MCEEIPTWCVELTRGDRLTFPVNLAMDGHDFTGATVTCVFKTDVESPNVLATVSASMTYPALGSAVAVVDVDGPSITDTWTPGMVIGEIKVVQSSPGFGPYRPARVLVTVKEKIAP